MNDDFRDLLASLIGADARFLIVGAHALAAHGVPRATGDLDVWIARDDANAERVWSALTRNVFQIGLPPRRIDVLTSISAVEFDEAWPDRIVRGVEGLAVPFIGRDAFIRNKRATGRAKDKADLEALGEKG